MVEKMGMSFSDGNGSDLKPIGGLVIGYLFDPELTQVGNLVTVKYKDGSITNGYIISSAPLFFEMRSATLDPDTKSIYERVDTIGVDMVVSGTVQVKFSTGLL